MVIGLVCAVGQELSAIEQFLDDARPGKPAGGATVVEGAIAGSQVVVMKTASCGKIGAAAATQFLIDRYEPSAAISFGAAGALVDGLDVGEIVVAERLVLGDSGIVHGEGFKHTGSIASSAGPATCQQSYVSDPALLQAAKTAGVGRAASTGSDEPRFGAVVTLDQVILSRHTRKYLNETFGALAVEMEAAAVAQVAHSYDVPFIAVKAVSDTIEFTADNIEVHLRRSGESRIAHWLRSARYLAVDPGSIRRLSELGDGMATASKNVAEVVAGLIEALD